MSYLSGYLIELANRNYERTGRLMRELDVEPYTFERIVDELYATAGFHPQLPVTSASKLTVNGPHGPLDIRPIARLMGVKSGAMKPPRFEDSE